VFAERSVGHESAAPPIGAPGCEKILLVGDGSSAPWPERCTSVPLPDFCRSSGALCYANKTRSGYRFAKAPATPAWRTGITHMGFNPSAARDGMLAVTVPYTQVTNVRIWHDEGWSYPEQLAEPAPNDVFREWRWIDQRANVGVNAESPIGARLELVARSFNRPRRLKLSIDGREIVTLLVPSNINAFRTPEFSLPAGRTLMTFESLDGSEPPNTTDPRRLSIQVYRIELVVMR
jgi:hypothetical protein